jgi:hypothetical protein
MSLTTLPTSLKSIMNQVLPGVLANILVALGFGDLIRTLPTWLRRKAPAANSYNLSTANVITLPDDAKAGFIFRAFARATSASGTLGPLTVDADGTAPADGHVSITPNGDLCMGTVTGAYTDVDVHYAPQKQDVFELTLTCVSNVATIPTTYSAAPLGVVSLLEAEVLAGTATGKKIVLVPNASPSPSAGQACLNLAKTTVTFNSSDAPTSVRLKFGVVSAIDVDAKLEAVSQFI